MTGTMDEALERMRQTSPELAMGGPNHGPMTADALISLGADESEVISWVDGYRGKLAPMPAAARPVTSENWRESLGHFDRAGDWSVFFARRLEEADWHSVLREWLPALVPGIMAAGTHGLIRVAHAVRELDGGQTPLRIEELAAALGYWAAYYQELPGRPELTGDLGITAALEQMPRLGSGYDAKAALPREFVNVLDRLPAFPAGVASLAAPSSVPDALTALTHAGAHFYLANASQYPLVMLHAVTGPSALRLLLPHLSPELAQTAFAYVWQSVAAWVSAFSAVPPGAQPEPAATEAEVVAACREIRDVHAIKFAEACVREYQGSADPIYLEAAMDWALRLRESRAWSPERRMSAGIRIRA